MDLESQKCMWEELLTYCNNDPTVSTISHRNNEAHGKKIKISTPPFDWFCSAAAKVLQAYPMGLSRAVLLTELEANW